MWITNLPAEILVDILSLTRPLDIRRCQQVCRRFRDLVVADQYLQYILELDISGYVAPSVPRLDLSYTEKIQILCRLRQRWQRNELAEPTYIRLQPQRIRTSCFVDGIFAHGYVNPAADNDHVRIIHYDQLRSINKGTGHKHWHHGDLGFDIRRFAIQPDDDLIVLLEEANQIVHQQLDDGMVISNNLVRYRLHLRTMSTNELHPATAPLAGCVPLNIDGRRNRIRHRHFQLRVYGHLVGIMFSSRVGLARSFTIIVLNWVTGSELACIKLPSVHYHTFDFLSHEYLVVPRTSPSSTGGNQKYTALGVLEVYQVPTQECQDQPPTTYYIGELVLPEIPRSQTRVAVQAQSLRSPATITPYPPAHCKRVPKIYAISDNYLLCVRVCISENILAGNSRNSSGVEGTLFVSSQVLLDEVSRKLQGSATDSKFGDPMRIPWEEWGGRTTWFETAPGHLIHGPFWLGEGLQAMIPQVISPQSHTAIPQVGLCALGFDQARIRARQAIEYDYQGQVNSSHVFKDRASGFGKKLWAFATGVFHNQLKTKRGPSTVNSPTVGSESASQVAASDKSGALKRALKFSDIAMQRCDKRFLRIPGLKLKLGAEIMMNNENIVVIAKERGGPGQEDGEAMRLLCVYSR